MDLYERRVEVPLPTVLRRSSAFGIRGRFLNKGTSCWLGSLLQALFSSAAMQCALLLHRCRAGLPCALCALTTTEENSRRIEQVYCIQSLWKPLVEDAQLSWREQQDPLQFFLKLCALAHTFFAPMFGASLDTTVTQTLPCQCGVELPEPHVFPRQLEYIVPLKVPRSADGPLNMEALIGMMQEERPENAMKCPICDAQAGFLAKHAWSFGPLVLFQLTRSIGSKTAVDLEAELDVLGRCYALRACVCHRGETNSGHYLCFVREPSTGLWIRYNDAEVPVRLPQLPGCLQTHCAFALYEEKLSDEQVAAFCMSTFPVPDDVAEAGP